jgi:hypothetical protein
MTFLHADSYARNDLFSVVVNAEDDRIESSYHAIFRFETVGECFKYVDWSILRDSATTCSAMTLDFLRISFTRS